MANLTEVPYFTPEIHEIARGEVAQGGPTGSANVVGQQLACRTQWLKQSLGLLSEEVANQPDQRVYTDNFEVTPLAISQKQVVLSHTPTQPTKVELSVFGGIEQRPNVDFIVTGDVLSWSGLALELLLDVGTAFTVRYSVY